MLGRRPLPQYLAVSPPRAFLFLLLTTTGCGRALAADPGPGIAERQGSGVPEETPIAPPVCGQGGWTTYAHDNQRTSASDGCIVGPLSLAWTFAPTSPRSANARATHVVASDMVVFVSGGIGETSVVWRLGVGDTTPAWTFGHGDSVRNGWPTWAGDRVYLVDDGVNVVNAATGEGHCRGARRVGREP